MVTKEKKQCKCCGEPAAFFHSKCCMAHFEGVVLPTGELAIVCEKCGAFAAKIDTQEIKNKSKIKHKEAKKNVRKSK